MAIPPQKPDRKSWLKNILLILAMEWLAQTSFYMTTPIMSGYASQLGASVSGAGIICGLSSLAALVFRPVSGSICAHVNRKRLLATSLLGYATCTLAMAFLPFLPLLVACRTLQGIFFAVQSTLMLSLVAESVSKDSLGQAAGWMGVAVSAASAIGPALSLGIASATSYASSCIASGLLALCTIALIPFAICEDSNPETKRSFKIPALGKRGGLAPSDLFCRKALPFAAISSIFALCASCISSYIALLAASRGIASIGTYFVVYSLVLFLARPWGGKISDRLSISRTIIPSSLLCTAAILLLAHAQLLITVVGAAILMACGYGIASPALQAECLRQADEGELDVASSTSFMGADLGNAAGPALAGSLIGLLGYTGAFGVEALLPLAAIGGCLAMSLAKR